MSGIQKYALIGTWALILALIMTACGSKTKHETKTTDTKTHQTQNENNKSKNNEQSQNSADPNLERLALVTSVSDFGYEITRDLTTKIGPRLAGSKQEARAREWAMQTMLDNGFENVRMELFKIDGWERGEAEARITSPYPQNLRITALGGSVPTLAEGIEAELAFFKDFEALLAAPEGSINGKIAYITGKMEKFKDGAGYGPANKKRQRGASEAAKRGAIAVLIRSVGTDSHRFPHTGQMRYDENIKKIPIAALSNPDADQIDRIFALNEDLAGEKKPVKVFLRLSPQSLGELISGNVMGEIKGREKPEEIILIGAHLDSWDEGTGAIDDGAGVGIVLGAAKAIMDSGLKPKRTIRVVLFGSEEIGLKGGFAYAEQHKDELKKHIIASESDFGAGKIYGLQADKNTKVKDFVAKIAPLFASEGISIKEGETTGGPDIIPLSKQGVPSIRLNQNGYDYFDLHHTPDDTFDKIDKFAMRQNIAAWAKLVWLISEADTDFRDEVKPDDKTENQKKNQKKNQKEK